MAINTVADQSVTSANNIDALGQNTQGSALANTIDTIVQNKMAIDARGYADAGGVVTVGGSANAITVTSASTYQLLRTGLFISFKAASANTTATTLNLDGLGARDIRRKGDVALSAGDIAANGRYIVIYDAAYNAAAGAWVLMNPEGYISGGTDVAVADGGTNISSYTAGDILYASAATTLSKLAKGTAGQALVMNAGATAPSWASALTIGTPVASTSGTAVNFTGIPSWVRRVTLSLAGVSTNGTSDYLVQIGPSGGIETTGYLGTFSFIQTDTSVTSTQSTAGMGIAVINASYLTHGAAVLTLMDASLNTWAMTFAGGLSGSNITLLSGASKSLAGTLDRIRLTTTGGTNTFDAGSVNILYE